MPFFAAAGIGGSLIFGNQARQQRKGAYGALAADIRADTDRIAGDYTSSYEEIIRQMRGESSRNIESYRTDMGAALQSYQTLFTQAQGQYAEGMDRSLAEYRTGRDSTLTMMRQQTEGSQRRTSARNAFSGIGMTSFGQNQINSIGAEGALREGVVREQYAQGLSALESQRAQGVSGMSAQYAVGVSGLQQNMATSIFGASERTAMNAATMGMQGAHNAAQFMQTGYTNSYNPMMALAQQQGGGSAAIGGALGAIGGGFLGNSMAQWGQQGGGQQAPRQYSYGSQFGSQTVGGWNNNSPNSPWQLQSNPYQPNQPTYA